MLGDIGGALAALTSLTRLDLETCGQISRLHEARVLQQLLKLPALVDLRLTLGNIGKTLDDYVTDSNVEQEVIAVSLLELSTLTSLSRLSLINHGELGVDDAAIVALAGGLTRLEYLDLYSSAMRTWAALPAIARLTNLRDLSLHNWQHVAQPFTATELQQLRSLSLFNLLKSSDCLTVDQHESGCASLLLVCCLSGLL